MDSNDDALDRLHEKAEARNAAFEEERLANRLLLEDLVQRMEALELRVRVLQPLDIGWRDKK